MRALRTLCAVAVALACVAATAAPTLAAPDLTTEENKTLYALGIAFSGRLEGFDLKPEELELVLAGLKDALTGVDPKVEMETFGPKINEYLTQRMEARKEIEVAAATAFLEKAAADSGAVKTESGLIYVETKAGSGASPTATSEVEVHYHGTLRDGTVFDSSVDRGQTANFPLNRVIPCWTEGLQKMKVGGKASLYCPAVIAYGDRGSGKIPPGAALRFDVELISIK